MTLRQMYDSDTATYPAGTQIIAAYVDGSRTGGNYAAARAAHPDALIWRISAVGEADADVIDLESGDVWPPAAAIPWIRRQLAAGRTPAYYCNTSSRATVLAAFNAAGLPPLPWWRADYNGVQALEMGEIAHQYADPPMTGGHWDASVIADDLPGLDGPASAGAGAQIIDQEDDLNTDESTWLKAIYDTLQVGDGLTTIGQTIVDMHGQVAHVDGMLALGPNTIGQTIVDSRTALVQLLAAAGHTLTAADFAGAVSDTLAPAVVDELSRRLAAGSTPKPS
jgi:hypothetical protein